LGYNPYENILQNNSFKKIWIVIYNNWKTNYCWIILNIIVYFGALFY
jgi:hypothetical protein